MWSEEDLENLEGSLLYEETIKLKDELIKDFEHIADAVPSFRYDYSLTEFLETWLAVESRQLKNSKFGSYTAPLVDILNHDADRNTKVYYNEGVQVRVGRDIAKGEALNWDYGDKGNFEFLKLYGFVLTDGSQLKSYSGHLDLSELGGNVQLAKVKRQILKRERMAYVLSEDFDSEDVMQLLSVLRIKVFDDAENA